MGIRVVRILPEQAWRRFVHEHPAGNIFHTPEMFQVFSRTKGYSPELWAAIDESRRILALPLPVQIALVSGLLRHFTTRSVAYGSVLCALGPKGHEALALLLQNYTQKVDGGPLFTELRDLSNMEAIQPIPDQHGFVYEDHLNYLINLKRPPEAIMQSIGSRTRKNIRRGLRRGEVVVEEAKGREQVGECYDLLRQTYQAAQVPLADRSLFEAAFDLLCPKDMVRFTLARVDHIPVAASVELLYKDVIYGWYGGVDRDYSSYVPGELAMWHILRWGAENSYRLYDFGGAGKPDEEYGVHDFKAKFGGELVCFGRNICVHAPFSLRLSQLGYQFYRRLPWCLKENMTTRISRPQRVIRDMVCHLRDKNLEAAGTWACDVLLTFLYRRIECIVCMGSLGQPLSSTEACLPITCLVGKPDVLSCLGDVALPSDLLRFDKGVTH